MIEAAPPSRHIYPKEAPKPTGYVGNSPGLRQRAQATTVHGYCDNRVSGRSEVGESGLNDGGPLENQRSMLISKVLDGESKDVEG